MSGSDALAIALHLAAHHVERAFQIAFRQREAGAIVQIHVDVKQRRTGFHRAGQAVGGAGDHAQPTAIVVGLRQLLGGVVIEGRRDFLIGFRQRQPGLQQLQPRRMECLTGFEALGMTDAAPGGHPVDVARDDVLFKPKAVTMRDPATEQIADGGQPDVWMRPDVGLSAGIFGQNHRAGMVVEHEGADHAAFAMRQQALHDQSVAQIGTTTGKHEDRHVRLRSGQESRW